MGAYMNIKIQRNKASYDYRRDPSKPFAWDNNDNNNSLDTFILFDDDGIELMRTPIQTVSNTEGIIGGDKFLDTVAPGGFYIKTDVERRSFYPRIHGIVSAKTMAGELIGQDSTTPTNQSRWLVHDWQKLKPVGPGQDTRVAWSAGCFVMPDAALVHFGQIIDAHQLPAGSLITGILEDI